MRDYGSRYAAQQNAGAPAPMRPSVRLGFASHQPERPRPDETRFSVLDAIEGQSRQKQKQIRVLRGSWISYYFRILGHGGTQVLRHNFRLLPSEEDAVILNELTS